MRITLAAILALSTPALGVAQDVGDGWWHTEGSLIKDAAGNVVRFSGVNWHGMDSENRIPHGLWGGTNRSIEDHLELVREFVRGNSRETQPPCSDGHGGEVQRAAAGGP